MDTSSGKTSALPINLRGSAANPLVENMNLSSKISEFSLSPDGKKVVAVAHGEVFAGAADESGEAVRITETAAPESFAAWSNDGKTLLVTTSAEGQFNLYTISLEELAKNRSAKQITSSPTFKSDAQFSPKAIEL